MTTNRTSDLRLLLYCGTSWVSKAIRWQTRSIYSHAAVLLPTGFVYEAWTKGGVVKAESVGANHKDGTVIDCFTFESNTTSDALIVTFLEQHLGDKYDYLSVLRFLDRRRESVSSQDKWFCSELVFAAMAYAGLAPLERIEAYAVNPGMLGISPKFTFERQIVV